MTARRDGRKLGDAAPCLRRGFGIGKRERVANARILSWNVNGIRSCVSKGFVDWLAQARADVVGLQETRAELEHFPAELRALARFPQLHQSTATSRKGYSGVALLSRQAPLEVTTELGDAAFDAEGRFQLARYPGVLIANVYFPNGSGKERDNARVPFKLAFTRRVFDVVEAAMRQTGLPSLVMGDFNTAPAAIDLARPKANEKTSGFLPEERRCLVECFERGFVDAFRALHPARVEYSWWSQRFGVREKNIGWRIDLVAVSRDLLPHVRRAFVLGEVRGSDHCPVGIEIAGGLL